MHEIQHYFSKNIDRNSRYNTIIASCRQSHVTVNDIARAGHKMMRQAKLHHHFFEDHSLLTNALNLAFFALGLPYDYKNEKYLSQKVSEKEAIDIITLFEKRISQRIPVEYVTQESYYLGNKFFVNENVLVPRSLMNTQFTDFLNRVHWQNNKVLDLCAGSGCIGITLALLNPNITVDLADISAKALDVARINVKNYELQDRIRCIQSNLFHHIQDKYDLIITNPPYVPEREYNAQPDEIKNEPKIALLAGKDGLDIVHQIIAQAKEHLNPNGLLISEIGHGAKKLLKKKYPKVPFQWLKSRPPSGIESYVDILIRWSGLLDSIFICEAKGLPDSFTLPCST